MSLLYKIDDVAKLLNVSNITVRREVIRGNLPAVKIGRSLRFNVSDVKKYIEQLPDWKEVKSGIC
jgi:putative molybdopterin biosynthesis protein